MSAQTFLPNYVGCAQPERAGGIRLRPMSVRPTRVTISKGWTNNPLYRILSQTTRATSQCERITLRISRVDDSGRIVFEDLIALAI